MDVQVHVHVPDGYNGLDQHCKKTNHHTILGTVAVREHYWLAHTGADCAWLGKVHVQYICSMHFALHSHCKLFNWGSSNN